jgi:glucose-1-phosphate adenylyltransferase
LFEIQATGADYVLILAGDHLYRMDYSTMAEYHWEKNADITVAVQPVPRSEASRLGILKREPNGQISAFVEKPKDPAVQDQFISSDDSERPLLGSMGNYLFKTKVLNDLLMYHLRHDDFGARSSRRQSIRITSMASISMAIGRTLGLSARSTRPTCA